MGRGARCSLTCYPLFFPHGARFDVEEADLSYPPLTYLGFSVLSSDNNASDFDKVAFCLGIAANLAPVSWLAYQGLQASVPHTV